MWPQLTNTDEKSEGKCYRHREESISKGPVMAWGLRKASGNMSQDEASAVG